MLGLPKWIEMMIEASYTSTAVQNETGSMPGPPAGKNLF
jgi:hypothetical protein